MPTLKAFLKARSRNVSGIKQKHVVHAIELVRAIGKLSRLKRLCKLEMVIRDH